jgi:hypothetical protein
MTIKGIDTRAGMTRAEATFLTDQLGDGVSVIDYFFFTSVPNCLRYAHRSAIPVRFYRKTPDPSLFDAPSPMS